MTTKSTDQHAEQREQAPPQPPERVWPSAGRDTSLLTLAPVGPAAPRLSGALPPADIWLRALRYAVENGWQPEGALTVRNELLGTAVWTHSDPADMRVYCCRGVRLSASDAATLADTLAGTPFFAAIAMELRRGGAHGIAIQ